jgi:hypothetical protein
MHIIESQQIFPIYLITHLVSRIGISGTKFMEVEVFTAMLLRITVAYEVMPRILIHIYQRFGDAYCAQLYGNLHK